MFIFEVLIYVFFAFYSSSLARKSENYIEQAELDGESTDVWDKYLKQFVAFFTIIAAIRCNVGSDNLSYALMFDRFPIDDSGKETLWWKFVALVQELGIHWVIAMGVCGFVQIYFITKTLKPYRWLLVFIPFVFLGGRYWMDSMNAVRQMTAACIFFWSSRFIYENKRVKYLVIVFVCSLIHQSSVLLFPLVLLPGNLSIEQQRWKLIAIFLVCFALGQTPAFQSVANAVGSLANLANYDSYATQMTSMLSSNYNKEALSFGPMMLTYLLIPIFIIWYGPELKERYADKVPYFSLWYNFAFFYACAYFLVCNIGHIFIRSIMYFSLFQMVMAAMLLHFLWTEYRTYGVRQLATIAFCIVIATNTAWDVTKASISGRYLETTTYKTIFFNRDKLDRLNL
jgi:hypothetical protein